MSKLFYNSRKCYYQFWVRNNLWLYWPYSMIGWENSRQHRNPLGCKSETDYVFVVGVYPYVRQFWPVLFTFFFLVSTSFLYNFPVLSVFGIILIWLSKTWAKCALSRVKSLRSLIKRAMSCYRFAHWALPVCHFSVTHVCLVTFCSVWCKTINAINKLCPVCLKCKTGNGAGDSYTVKVITCTTRSWSF